MPDYSAVAVSKAALASLTRYLAVELAPRGIRVNAVSAGWVEASEGEHSYRGGVSDAVRPHVPAGRNVAPEDVAAAVAWVCSGEAPMLVGQTIHLDGGFGLAAWNAILDPDRRWSEAQTRRLTAGAMPRRGDVQGDAVAATTVVCWNIARRQEPWRQLAAMDADVALLQEATPPPPDVADTVDTGPRGALGLWNSRWYEAASIALSTAGRWWCGCPTASRSSGSGKSARSARRKRTRSPSAASARSPPRA